MVSKIVEAELSLRPPESVAYGDETVRVGGTVYRALKFLMARTTGGSLDTFAVAVWGKAEVQNETVRSLIWRANNLLRGLQCPKRVMLAGDKVLFE